MKPKPEVEIEEAIEAMETSISRLKASLARSKEKLETIVKNLNSNSTK